MAETLARDARRNKSHNRQVVRGAVVRRIRELFGSRTDEAAHQKGRRIVTDYQRHCQILAMEGRTETLLAHQVWINDLLDSMGPVPTIRTALREAGEASRSEDESRELALLSGYGREALQLEDRRLGAEMARNLRARIAIRRHLAVVCPAR